MYLKTMIYFNVCKSCRKHKKTYQKTYLNSIYLPHVYTETCNYMHSPHSELINGTRVMIAGLLCQVLIIVTHGYIGSQSPCLKQISGKSQRETVQATLPAFGGTH